MERTINALKVRVNLGECLDSSFYRGDEFVIERAGKPIAALIPLSEFKALKQIKQGSFKTLDRIWEKTEGIKLSKKDIENATKAVRAE